jgi:hypothetical protein
MQNLGEIFERVKKGEAITAGELLSLILVLIRSNTAFTLAFVPRTQTAFATLQLTIIINPKLSTAVIITVTDKD